MSTNRTTWLAQVTPGLSERDAHLLDRASALLEANIIQPTDDQSLPWAPLRGICPSPSSYNGVWNWDSAFHALAVGRWDRELAYEQVRIFLERQLENGMLPDVIFASGKVVETFGKPPVFPWACLRLDQLSKRADMEFLRYCYEHFKPYEEFWRRERRGKGEKVFHYDSVSKDPGLRHNEACMESGWDNSVRWDVGSHNLWAVDLNCYMVMVYKALYEMAHLLESSEQDEWYHRGQELRQCINDTLWHDELGVYCDTYRETGEATGILSPASFMPLFAGIAPLDRAARMAAVASSPYKFYPGMPTVAYDNSAYSSSEYWRGPTWLNTAWFAAKGLQYYDYDDVADTIRETVLGWVDSNTDTVYEYYDSRSGKGLGARQFGWSAAFVIEFILDW